MSDGYFSFRVTHRAGIVWSQVAQIWREGLGGRARMTTMNTGIDISDILSDVHGGNIVMMAAIGAISASLKFIHVLITENFFDCPMSILHNILSLSLRLGALESLSLSLRQLCFFRPNSAYINKFIRLSVCLSVCLSVQFFA
jgi:hypothetical protein